jgi:hypothetical protein
MAPLLTGALSGVGAWWWVKEHSHPELVHRNELDLLRSMMASQHEAVLRELQLLRDLLDRGGRGR